MRVKCFSITGCHELSEKAEPDRTVGRAPDFAPALGTGAALGRCRSASFTALEARASQLSRSQCCTAGSRPSPASGRFVVVARQWPPHCPIRAKRLTQPPSSRA